MRTDADLLLFLHDDAVLEPGSVELMVKRLLADETTAIVGPKVVSWEDPESLEEVGMAIDRLGYPYKGLEEHEIDLGQHDTAAEVFYVTSTCMLIRHEVFKQLRGWDARMRAYAEDLDLCWRAHRAGWDVAFEPEAVVGPKAAEKDSNTEELLKTPLLVYARTVGVFAGATVN